MDREKLIAVGIDYDEALKRFAGATDLFEGFLKEMAIMRVIEPLRKALADGNVEEAFAVAHTLKGNFGNMSAKPLFEKITPVAEELKKGNLEQAKKLYMYLEQEYNIVAEGITKAM